MSVNTNAEPANGAYYAAICFLPPAPAQLQYFISPHVF